MGKLKSTIIDLDDLRDDYFTLEPEMVLDDDMPDREDWAVRDLLSAIKDLEVYKPYHYKEDLKEALERLTKLVDEIRVPF